jgi:hypothetical protein
MGTEWVAAGRALTRNGPIVMKLGGVSMIQYRVEVTYPNGASIRPAPSTNNTGVGVYPAGTMFYASAIVPDLDDPTNQNKSWAVVESDPLNLTKYAGMFVAVKYPSASRPEDRATEEPVPSSEPLPAPQPTDGTITVHVELDDNGTIFTGDVTLTRK